MSMHFFRSSNLTLKVFNEPIYSSSFLGKALSSDKEKRKNHYQTGIGIENFDVANVQIPFTNDERNGLHSF